MCGVQVVGVVMLPTVESGAVLIVERDRFANAI